ncbi:MAG: dipeptidase [Gammaproteobacteria bacterium]|nr:dipeptidase [Gammaproteobacteria bacterium]
MTTPRSITRRLALLATLATVACTGTSDDPASAASAESEEEMIARASAIHERVTKLDTHVDINTSNFTAERNYIMDLPTQVTLPKMEAGGLDVAWFVVFTGQGPLDDEGYAAAYDNAMDKFNSIHRLVEEYAPDRIELALTSDDVRRIAASGKLVAMIGVENAYSLGLDLSRIEQFHALGARYMSLAHTGPSQLSDAHSGEQDGNFLHGGLSEIGREAIAEMNRLGIMIDISHPSKPSIMQTLELTRAPVMASHSAARALSDVSRNLDDEQLLAVGENGGVVQTVALRRFTNRDKAETRQQAIGALAREIAAEMGVELMDDDELARRSQVEQVTYAEAMAMARRQATERVDESGTAPDVDVSDFVDHIDYLVDLIGLEHVGISSDFDGGGGVEGWDDASETFNVTLELVRRGYSEEEIGMLWSGNLLRVLDEVQAIAAEIQAGEG